jgi:Ca-activated chloride channel family protein
MSTLGTKLILVARLSIITLVTLSAVTLWAQDPSTQANPPASQQAKSATSDQKPPESASTNDQSVPTIKTGTNEVNVVFTVTDKRGRRITDLKQNDFRVVDDNKPP